MTSSATGRTKAGHAGIVQSIRELPTSARVVLVGVFVNQFGAFLQLFMTLYLVDGRGFSNAQAGIALGCYAVGTIAGTLFGGGLSDRIGPRWTIVMSVGAAAVFTLSITVLDSFAAIVVAVVLAGFMTQSARPAVSALLFGLVPEARQVMTFAIYRMALNIGAIAGPLVGVVLSRYDWDLVFYVDGLTALVYCAIAAFLLPAGVGVPPAKAKADEPIAEETAAEEAAAEEPAADEPAADEPAAGKGGYLTVIRDRKYVAYLALMLANGLVHIQSFIVLPLMLRDDGYDTWAYGMLASINAFMVIAFELLITRNTQRWPAWVAVITGWLLLAFGRGVFGLPGGLTVVVVAMIIGTVGQIIGGPTAFAYPAKVAPKHAVGRYIGSAHAMFALGYAVGPAIGVLLWSQIGKAFWGVCLLFGLVMVVPGIWGMRPPAQRTPTGGGGSSGSELDGAASTR